MTIVILLNWIPLIEYPKIDPYRKTLGFAALRIISNRYLRRATEYQSFVSTSKNRFL